MLRIAVCAAVLVTGCFGSLIQGQAMDTAAAEHQCPRQSVQLASDATVGGDHAYWLDVCGKRRFYRYQQTSTAGVGSGRFVDDTNRFQASGGTQ